MRRQRLTVEHETLATERDEIERELERVGARERSLGADLERATARHRDLEAAFDAAQGRLDEERRRREAVNAEGAGRRGRLELLAERLRATAEEAARLARRRDELAAQSRAWREESARLAGRRDELVAAIAAGEREVQVALEDGAAAGAQLVASQQDIEGRREAVRRLEEDVQDRRNARDAVRGHLGDLRIREATLRQEGEHIAAAYGEEFREPLSEAVAGAAADAPDAAELPAIEADLARCKQSIEQLGPVNVLAADEYSEQEERHRFLTAQRADVVRSIDSLKATIREINATSSERFVATFRTVNEQFRTIFAELFRGGEAEMRLLDEDDVLESGIEIVARPPGKRLQNLMLLSGGEKALTAIALLFALFRAKPSPFCILDEVDAPLDDVNTLRFVDLLTKMARDTQFIVITHNKLTMEAAARLYGVTMQERGVSTLVAVTLAAVQPGDPEPAAASA
jgi:chromosome segregation protein